MEREIRIVVSEELSCIHVMASVVGTQFAASVHSECPPIPFRHVDEFRMREQATERLLHTAVDKLMQHF